MATSSSAEFPYPQHAVQTTSSSLELNALNKIANAIRTRFFNCMFIIFLKLF